MVSVMGSTLQRSRATLGAVASLQEAVRKVLRSRVEQGEAIVLAASGGLDSMVLLDLVSRVNRTANWRLIVAHFNHRLRGRNSDADERLVLKVARELGLEAVSGAGDVAASAKREKVSIEMAARKLRHDFLASTAATHGARFILTAHHADDQIELFFIRLLRGAGGMGLGGMQVCSVAPGKIQQGGAERSRALDAGAIESGDAIEQIFILRPLLSVSRAELEGYAAAAGVRFRTDASNKSSKFLRNRIRNELLPFLSRKFHANIPATVARVMEIAGAEAAFVEEAAQKWLGGKRRRFTRLHVAVQRRCIYHQVASLGVSPDFALIEHLRQSPGVAVTAGGRTLVLGKEGIVQCSGGPSIIPQSSEARILRLTSDGARGAPSSPGIEFEGVRLSWRVVPCRGTRPRASECVEHFDADAVGDVICLRHWRPGDRMRPIGMVASVKLQDLFTNAKVPRQERSCLLVAEDARGTLFWVEGLRISEEHKLTVDTRRALRWEWSRVGGLPP
jgi:tRNA(Ile)-lysidine synthase